MRAAENRINGSVGPDLAAYRDSEARRSSLQRRLASLQEKFDEQARFEGELLGKAPTVVDTFDVELENLAAEELLRKIKPDALAARREEISKRRAVAQKAMVAWQRELEAVRPGLSGLRRLLEQAQADLQKLEEDTNDLRDDALVEQAEAIGAEYLAAAEKVWETWLRLEVLRGLLGNRRRRDFGSPYVYDLRLPSFRLESFERLPVPTFWRQRGLAVGWELAAGHSTMDPAVSAAGEVERERLRALGISA